MTVLVIFMIQLNLIATFLKTVVVGKQGMFPVRYS